MGRFADAIELYESAMQGPLGNSDPALMKGLARARMLSGDGAGAEALFVKVKADDPAAYDSEAELAQLLRENADEPRAELIARLLKQQPLETPHATDLRAILIVPARTRIGSATLPVPVPRRTNGQRQEQHYVTTREL